MRVSANGKVRRSAEEWRESFHRFTRSGLPPAEFCAREGIALGSFKTWSQRSRRRATVPAPFIEVVPNRGEPQRWAVEVELPSGAIVRLRGSDGVVDHGGAADSGLHRAGGHAQSL